MTKLQEKQLGFKGSITPFLSLVFLLLLSLAGAMLQSVSIQTAKSIRRAEMSLALENVFAEYHVELLEKYEVFVKEGSSKRDIVSRLEFYGVTDTEHKIVKSTLLSDGHGQAFYEQALASMGQTAEETMIPIQAFSEEKEKEIQEQFEGLEMPTENNPIEAVNQLRKSSLLSLVYPNREELSNQNVQLEQLPSHRTLETGIEASQETSEGSVKNQCLFMLYLMDHFSNMHKSFEEHPLAYEVEYLIGGKSSDQENLKVVAEKLMGVRMAVNYAYLMTDQARQAEAEAVAMGLCSLVAAPEAAPVVKQALLAAWAYGESIVDVRLLLKGEKVPLVKTMESWQLQIGNLLQLKNGEAVAGEASVKEGVTYEDYLKAFLVAQDREILCMRALDLLELNTGIQVDHCITQLEIKSTSKLQRNVTYTFQTNYQYQ